MIGPLLATLALQTLATGAVFSVPAAAPAIAESLNVEPHLVGYFVSMVYGLGIISAVLSPPFITRYGAVRVGQFTMLGVLAMALTAGSGGILGLAVAALLIGSGYGATAPVATHILVPRTPPHRRNFILSVRQIGVPLGGVMAATLVPFLVTEFSWRHALLLQAIPAALLLIWLHRVRGNWDRDRQSGFPVLSGNILKPLRLLKSHPAIRQLSVICFIYAGIQICFVAFMTVHLTSAVGFDLLLAGQMLAVYQIAGVVSRPIWGWFADKWMGAQYLLAIQGVIMGGAAVAAGQFGPNWNLWGIIMVCVLAGVSAAGFTGIAYAEFARQGGEERTEATAVGSAAMFAGVLSLPSLFSLLISALESYAITYGVMALMGFIMAALCLMIKSTAKEHGVT